MTPPLALLGGAPTFPQRVPFVRPSTPTLAAVTARLESSWESGRLTNGPLVRELEAVAADRLGVPHVVAVSTCTTGLMLVLRVLQHLGDLDPDAAVALPSFTFSASAHAVAWNGARCRFAECDPFTFQLDFDDAKARLDGVGALLVTHVFGAPARPRAAADLAATAGIPLVFDAAHAFGATHDGVPVGGFGTAEVFSLTPTKPIVAGEGGLVATRRRDIAEALVMGRDYANPGNYDTQFVGLNGRMSELHAAVALCSLDRFDADLARRCELAARYRDGLADVPGVRVQRVDDGDVSTYKDFTIALDDSFGVDRDVLVRALAAEGVDTRCYFDPPVHRQRAHARDAAPLPVTDDVARRVVSLPIYSSLADETVDAIVDIIAAVATHARQVRAV